uniref:Uncharacterized protein n=1 Tax=Rhizophora mucronata TaxID=61149 RepID=A0A2P2MH42_RHIMU
MTPFIHFQSLSCFFFLIDFSAFLCLNQSQNGRPRSQST